MIKKMNLNISGFPPSHLESYKADTNLYHTSCVVTKAEITSDCDDDSSSCGFRASIGDCSKLDEKDWMDENCQKSCNTCPTLPSLENEIQHEEIENIITTFNVSLDFHTDSYAKDTSWSLASQDRKDHIYFDSSESVATAQLENNERHAIQYSCIISQKQEHENQPNDETKPICYHFEVHDSFGDGMCCKYGDGSFSMSLGTKSSALKIEDDFHSFSVMKTSFCVNRDSGEIESEGKFSKTTKEQPTHSHYPFRRWQCKNQPCVCDFKPSLSSNIPENLSFLFQVTMLSDSDKLQDVESAQYKAACWVLYDDPYEYDLVDGETHNRMIQRYILAVFYIATSPEKWSYHSNFLSSRSECEWNYDSSGISCDEDDNVIEINLGNNPDGDNLEGSIVNELSGLKMLEKLVLSWNNIHGPIPSVLGRLSELRYLNLNGNDLGGIIPPKLFDATNLEELYLYDSRLEGTIPETIGNLQKLYWLDLGENNLSGSIPDAIYTLKNLENLHLEDNKLSSSISTFLGNLNELGQLWLEKNMLTGQIPSTIRSLSSLYELNLGKNKVSGPIPDSLFDLPDIKRLNLLDNSVTGSVPDEFCDRVLVQADCRNDVFDPEVSCSCCPVCKDETPIRNGDCADATVKVVIDHESASISSGLEWSLTNDATGKKILYDGPYPYWKEGLQTYKACVAYSDCLTFNQISTPIIDTNYHIYWNDESIHNGTFQGLNLPDYIWNDDIKEDRPRTTLSFSYDEENQQVPSCYDVKLECYEPLLLQPNTNERIMYDQAVKLSGRSIIRDTSSPQSKALCWMLSNNHHENSKHVLDTEFGQRYILATLHFMSPNGLFGNNEYLAEKHECDWNGISCRYTDNTKIVAGISLSNQIINGTLIDEIGSLKYLKELELNQTQLHGTIPRSFSNLWSLMKLDLSDNEISSTIPSTLFRQLNKLEYINLSNCQLSGSINDDIGSFSRISTLLLRDNLLTGSLPLESFKHYDLEHLDTSENKLNQIDFSPLLKHKNLKYFDISSNFLVGSLPDHTFTSLTQLKYFNASQNDIAGTIPLSFPELANITHIDLHANKLRGPIPSGITELQKIQHLNLQGNKLTGSLSSEINQLQSLTTLVLSHNELKGSIPFNQTNLHKMERLHLHSNKLEGVAPTFNNINYYITDCGFPSDSLDPVKCSTCNICCNSDGGCQSKSTEELSQVYKSLIFMFVTVSFIITCYALKDRITSNKYLKSFFEEKVKYWNALMLVSDKSVYHFLLIDNKTEWYTAVVCGIFQIATLFLFVHSADMMNDTSDREYFMLCPANSIECENLNRVSPYGIFVFGLILTIWLLRDIIGSVKLMLVSFEKRNIDFFFTSAVVFSVTMLSLWTSTIYIVAIAGKNTDMIKDAVVLLFVIELDERIFQLVESVNPDWVHAIDRNMRNSLVYEGKNLIISSWIKKISESFVSMSEMIRRRNDVPPQLDSEDEDVVVVRRDSDVSEGFHAHALEGESAESSNP